MNSKYNEVGLYKHNANSYDLIKQAYESGEQIVGILHATGTGKTYNALQLVYDNKDKKTIFYVPKISIIEHIEETIDKNPNLDRLRDFSNLEFRTYSSLVNMTTKEIENLDIDLLIIDEFHHLGAPIWGQRIKEIIESHSKLKVFGMSAYSVRDRGTAYERDMADSNSDEIFSNKIVSRYDLCDAIIDGVLTKPIYRSVCIDFRSKIEYVRELLETRKDKILDYTKYNNEIENIKKQIAFAKGVADLIKQTIKLGGKYIYFCPPSSEDGFNDINLIMQEAEGWFKEYIDAGQVEFYRTTSADGADGDIARKAFYNDKDIKGHDASKKIRIMFAINQYNEGVHVPNIDGVILGRGTSSDIIFFEQIGRALAVRGDTSKRFNELEKLSFVELMELAKKQEITISTTKQKEDLMEQLLAPIIIDLANNHEFIQQLENNLKYRIKEVQQRNKRKFEKREIKITKENFDVEVLNVNLFNLLLELKENVAPIKWHDMYELAKSYYEHHGSLDIQQIFKTKNGYEYDELGENLGVWILNQRVGYKHGSLSEERIKLLLEIGIIFENKHDIQWKKMYELAKSYCEHHGTLATPRSFKTKNGYEYDELGENLGVWISRQKVGYKSERLSEERIKLLLEIGMIFTVKKDITDLIACCEENGLDYKSNPYLINNMSYQEFVAKTNYLLENNMPINNDGKLHELYFMCDEEMIAKYNVSKAGLVYDYFGLYQVKAKR